MTRIDLLAQVIAAADAWTEARRAGDSAAVDTAYGHLMTARAALHAHRTPDNLD